ncbi:MAG: MBL fold metallo-hydrolase [Deferrisomatales bacterium]
MSEYPRELAPGLWALGDRYTNLYLVRGRRSCALLEAGISAGVDAAIRQLEGLSASPDVLVVPHPHPDHVTGLPGLRARYPRAEVLAGPGAQRFLEHPRTARAALEDDRHLWDFYCRAGLTPGRPPLETPPSLQGARVVPDGEERDLGGLTLRFLAISGHAPGQLAVHVPEVGALAVSDALGFRFPERGFLPVYFTSYAGHLAALDRLEALGPRIVCPAHLGPLVGEAARRVFPEAREAARGLAQRIRQNRARLDELAEELFREVYADEFLMYTEANIRTCVALLIRRSLEEPRPPP